MKKALIIFLILAITPYAFGNGVSLNSPGTKALSMAGAMTTIVNDYSAPFWNPAGLQHVTGPQITFFATDIIPFYSYDYYPGPETAEAKKNNYVAPNFAVMWPCFMNKKIKFAASMLVTAGLGTEWEGGELLGLNGPSALSQTPNVFVNDEFDWESNLSVINLSLTGSYNVMENMAFGAAVHVVKGDMNLKRGVTAFNNFTLSPLPQDKDTYLDSQYEDESDGWGYGFGLGIQYKFHEKFSAGLMMRSPMTVDFSGDFAVTNDNATFAAIYEQTYGVPFSGTLKEASFDREITMPLRMQGGIAFHPNEKFVIALEAQWSQWSEYEDYVIAEYEIDGEADQDTLTLLWDDAIQLRVGGEYMAKENLAIRGGFYYDPAPGPDKTQTILIPNATFYGLTTGFGYTIDHFTIDGAFEYLFGKERDIDSNGVVTGVGMPGIHQIDIFAMSLALTYKF
ncbi:MAG: outer membrane protein transport protein [bacterium]